MRAFLMLLAVAGAAQAGLVGYWTFDSADVVGTTASDVSGNNNDGALQRGPTAVPGIIGDGAMSFDGTNDYMEVAHSASLNLNTPFTVATWVNTSDTSGTWFRALVAKYGLSSITPSWGLGWTGEDTLGFYVREGGSYPRIGGAANEGIDGEWHHFAGVRGNGMVRYYMDGSLVAQTADTEGDIRNSRPITLARHHSDTTGNHIEAIFDDTAIWDRALSGDALQYIASNRFAAASPDVTLQFDPVAYWRLNEAGGSVVADSSGNGHVGTYGGTVGFDVSRPALYDPANTGVSLSGSPDRITMDAALPAEEFNTDYAISLWFNADGRSQDDLVAMTTGAGHAVLLELQLNGDIRYLHRVPAGSSGGQSIFSNAHYDPGVWHHLVAVNENGQMSLYLDGLLDSTLASSGILNLDLDVTLGRISPGNDARSFQGDLDEVAFFNRALTIHEVQSLYFGQFVPEPTTMALLALGLAALRRRKR